MKLKILLLVVFLFLSACAGQVRDETSKTYHIETSNGKSLTVSYYYCYTDNGQNSIIVNCFNDNDSWVMTRPDHVYVATEFYVVESE